MPRRERFSSSNSTANLNSAVGAGASMEIRLYGVFPTGEWLEVAGSKTVGKFRFERGRMGGLRENLGLTVTLLTLPTAMTASSIHGQYVRGLG